MISKRSIIVVLAGLNAFLALGLLAGIVSLPRAYAQSGRGGGFISVAAKAASQAYDVVYILDRQQEKLHAFYPADARSGKLAYGQFRDLKKDFGK